MSPKTVTIVSEKRTTLTAESYICILLLLKIGLVDFALK